MCLQGGNSDDRKAREKVPDVVSHQGNANQNRGETPPHAGSDGRKQEVRGGQGCGDSGTLAQCWWECTMMQPLGENSPEGSQMMNRGVTT